MIDNKYEFFFYMRNIIFTIFLFLNPCLLKSQEIYSIDLISDISIHNSSLNAKTILNSLAYIDENQKQAILRNINDENFFYANFNNEIKLNSKKGYSISYGTYLTSHAIFNNDLVRLALYGNASSTPQSLSLTPFKALLYHYSSITLGYNFSENFSTSVSLISGHNFLSTEFSEFVYNSGENGQFISYDLAFDLIENINLSGFIDNGSSQFENKSLADFFSGRGSGLSVGFNYKFKINDGICNLSVNDLGYIIWDSPKPNSYSLEVSDIITPLEVNDFSDIGPNFFTAELDTLRDIMNKNNESYKFILPALINGYFKKEITNNKHADAYTISLAHKIGIYPTPRVSIDFHKKITQHEFVLGYHFGGLERNGLQFKYNIKMDDFHLEIFTKQANILNLNSVYGLNIGLGIKYFLDN
tara:strand:- start:525 stop:1769 length:1245 start_codon:yes stop_codon:yes gene_type:complete